MAEQPNRDLPFEPPSGKSLRSHAKCERNDDEIPDQVADFSVQSIIINREQADLIGLTVASAAHPCVHPCNRFIFLAHFGRARFTQRRRPFDVDQCGSSQSTRSSSTPLAYQWGGIMTNDKGYFGQTRISMVFQ